MLENSKPNSELIENAESDNIIVAEMPTEQLVQSLNAVLAAQGDGDVSWIQYLFSGEGKVEVSAIGHHLSIKYDFLCKHEGRGIVKIPGKQLIDYVKQLPPGKVILKAELPSRLIVKCGRSSARLQLIQDPTTAKVDIPRAGTFVQIKGDALSRFIAAFKDFVLLDDTRYYANGAYLWVETDEAQNPILNAVASDALRLAKTRLSDEIKIISNDGSAIIVPKKTLDEIYRVATANSGRILNLYLNQEELFIALECDTYFMVSKCIAGSYPPYEAAIPQQVNINTKVNISLLQDALRRSLVLADKGRVMQFKFDGTTLELLSHTPGLKEGDDVIDLVSPIETSFEVNYNGSLLMGLLAVLNGTNATFEWEGPARPVRITGEQEQGLDVFYLLVPTRF